MIPAPIAVEFSFRVDIPLAEKLALPINTIESELVVCTAVALRVPSPISESFPFPSKNALAYIHQYQEEYYLFLR